MTVSVRLYTCNNKLIATGVKVSVKFYSDKQKKRRTRFCVKNAIDIVSD